MFDKLRGKQKQVASKLPSSDKTMMIADVHGAPSEHLKGMLANGADINIRRLSNGMTPLMFAVCIVNSEMVRLLFCSRFESEEDKIAKEAAAALKRGGGAMAKLRRRVPTGTISGV